MSLLNSIRTEILKIVKNDPKKIDYKNKEIDFKEYEMNKEEYINSVCNFKSFKELEECNPIIEFTNKTTKSLWKKILCHTSSVKTLQPPGKSISYFIKSNDKIIGLVSLTSGQRDIANRDAYIGWNRDYQYQNVNFIFNISTCVAVQPLGYNFNIGKLLASSVFCKEVQEQIKEKYGHYAIAYYTFSIHGRSIQYERLKELKYVGLTKGKSFIIPEDLYEMMKKYVKEKGLYNKIKNKSHLKRIIILTVLEDLEIDRKKVHHHLERGIYVGYSFPESKQILCEGKIEEIMNKELPEKIKSFDEIFNFWKGRWAEQRFNHLLKNKRLKHMVSWSKKDAVERNRTYQKNFQEKRRKELGNEEYKKQRAEIVKKYSNSKEKLHLILENYIKILSFKGEATVKEVVNVMKETIPDLTENKVKKIWCGILQPR